MISPTLRPRNNVTRHQTLRQEMRPALVAVPALRPVKHHLRLAQRRHRLMIRQRDSQPPPPTQSHTQKITAHHSNHKNHCSKTTNKILPIPQSRKSRFRQLFELVLNFVKKQSCRSFAAKLPLQRQFCSKLPFHPNPQILRNPPFHTPKRRHPLHPPRHTPNPAKKHPNSDHAATAASNGIPAA